MSPSFIVDHPIVAIVYAMAIYGIAFLVAALLVRQGEPRRLTESGEGRIGALDGLRGVLALGVLVHHSVTSYVWATTGTWTWSSNAVLNQLGQTTVALFFMITGFLFARKAMRPVDWMALYRGRLARLGPLYLAFVVIVFAIVLVGSDGLRESPLRLAEEFARWAAFVCFGRPDVNGYHDTWIIAAGVNWSLRYEAIFYVLAVPALFRIHRMVSVRSGLFLAVAGMVACVLVWRATGHQADDLFYCIHFLGGIVVAYAFSLPRLREMLGRAGLHWAAAASAVALVFLVKAENVPSIVAATIIFAAVVGGASVFGLLKCRAAIWLGDVSYGIYLLHGIALWCGHRLAPHPMSLVGFAAFASTITVLAVLIASASYLRLELPVMRWNRRAYRPSPGAGATADSGVPL